MRTMIRWTVPAEAGNRSVTNGTMQTTIESMMGKKVIFTQQLDDSVIGGFIVKIKDTVIDLSIKTQLEKMRKQLVQG